MDGLRRPAAFLAAAAVAAGLLWRLSAAWPAGDAAPYAVPQEEYFLTSVMLRATGVYSVDPGGAPSTGRGPLYPSFLAAAQFGSDRPSPRRARTAQAVLGGFAALAAGGLGALLLSPAAGAFAASFVALDPALVAAVRGLDVHGFYGAVILLLGFAAAVWAQRDGDRASGNALGLALGVSLLCRSAHLLALPLLVLAALTWWGRAGLRRSARVLLVAGFVLVPWTMRGWTHTGRLLPLDAGVGAYNLLAAAGGGDLAVRYEEAFALAESLSPGFTALHREEPEPVRDAAVMRLAVRTIIASPLDYLRGCARRLAAFWLPLWFFLLPAAFAALRPRASRGTRAAALVAASFSTYAAIGLGEGYRLGVEPLLAALAGLGAASFLPRAPIKSALLLRSALPLAAAVGAAALGVRIMTPVAALASRRAWQPDCRPPAPYLAAFLDDGVRLAGDGWYLAPWAGTLRARPEVCAGMAAFEAGDAKEAALRFDAAAMTAPLDPEIRISLAVALGAAGQKKRALTEAKKAEELAGATRHPSRLRESIRSTRAGLQRR